MARSHWKGNTYLKSIHVSHVLRTGLIDKIDGSYFKSQKLTLGKFNNNRSLGYNLESLWSPVLYRRNQLITTSLIRFWKCLKKCAKVSTIPKLDVYNGYDFFPQTLLDEKQLVPGINLAGSISTREQNVVHKAKLSRAARHNQKLRDSKKKSSIVTKTGTKVKKILQKKK